MRTVYPVGTTLYKPDRCSNGHTIIFRRMLLKLIDMNGRTVNSWDLDTSIHEHGTFLLLP